MFAQNLSVINSSPCLLISFQLLSIALGKTWKYANEKAHLSYQKSVGFESEQKFNGITYFFESHRFALLMIKVVNFNQINVPLHIFNLLHVIIYLNSKY